MKSSGFSYIELMFTVAILALIATTVMPYVELTVTRKKEAELSRSLRDIRNAIDAYKQAVDDGKVSVPANTSGYPEKLSLLVDGVPDAKDPLKRKLYFLRRLPRDPMNTNSALSAAQTWGLRSFESPPNAPVPGADVFDVYSMSNKKGLNGVPYNEW